MHYDLYRIKDESELKHLGIFSDKQETIKIIEWPQLIDIPFSNKLEAINETLSGYNRACIVYHAGNQICLHTKQGYVAKAIPDLIRWSKSNSGIEISHYLVPKNQNPNNAKKSKFQKIFW